MEKINEWLLDKCEKSKYDGPDFDFNLRIETLTNPGWILNSRLEYTRWAEVKFDMGLIEKTENNWYRIYIDEKQIFNAVGDPSKLKFLLVKFIEFWENGTIAKE